MKPIRVLIVDDDIAITQSLRCLIDNETDMDVVGAASDGDTGVNDALLLLPDVVLLDVQMPRLSGIEALRMLLRQPHPPRVIMLTMFDLDEYVYEAFRIGAAGFLVKTSPPSAIVGAIRSCRESTSLIAPEITQRLISHLAPHRPDAKLSNLTPRELEALKLIGQGLSNEELARALFVTPTTARTYVSRIMTKVGATHRAQLVVLAYENRLVQPSQQ